MDRSFASISVSELIAGALALALLGASMTSHAQTPSTAPPVAAPNKESRVLADPDTRLYMPCRTGDERESNGSVDSYKPNPKATVMTEEAAKAKGFRASAHKVPCPS